MEYKMRNSLTAKANALSVNNASLNIDMKYQKACIYGFHVVTCLNILLGISIWIMYGLPVYPMRCWSFGHFAYYLLLLAVSLVMISLIECCIAKRDGMSLLYFAKCTVQKYSNIQFLWLAVSAIISFEIVMTVHTTIKQFIPFINQSRYDMDFLQIGKFLHFGVSLPLCLASPYDFLGTNVIFDKLYYYWFYLKAAAIAYFISRRDAKKCDMFLSTLFFMYGIGVVVGLLLPSFGPFYILKDSFPASDMVNCRIVQTVLSTISDGVSYSSMISGDNLFFGYGLMAMPSLHVSVCFLYVVFFWNENRILRAIAIVYLFVIFLTSMMSGWHYAIDGYAAIPLTFISIYLSRVILDNISSVASWNKQSSCRPWSI